MNFNHNGKRIATIVDKKNNRSVEDVYFGDYKNKDFLDEITLDDKYEFQLIPDNNSEDNRHCLFVAGPSGSGKSYIIRNFTLQYICEYPKRNIYLFSYLKNDKTLDAVKKIMRLDIYHV